MKQAVIIIAVLVLAGLGFVLTREDKESTDQSSNNTTQQSQPSPSPSTQESSGQPVSDSKVITYSDDGFSPNTLTVNSGDTVTIKNSSSESLEFDSDPHPQHTANTELNVGLVEPGESKDFKVTTKGTHGYHNHLNSRDVGSLVVQ